jgi:hypothetical protein
MDEAKDLGIIPNSSAFITCQQFVNVGEQLPPIPRPDFIQIISVQSCDGFPIIPRCQAKRPPPPCNVTLLMLANVGNIRIEQGLFTNAFALNLNIANVHVTPNVTYSGIAATSSISVVCGDGCLLDKIVVSK